jgi:hypothetical protein
MLRLYCKGGSCNVAQEGRTVHTSCCFSKSAKKRNHLRRVGLILPFNREVILGLISSLMHKILINLHIIRLLKSSTCFEHFPVHLQEVYVVILYMQPLVSSLSAGDCPVHWLRKNSHLQRVTIPEAAYIQLRRRPLEDEQGSARNM